MEGNVQPDGKRKKVIAALFGLFMSVLLLLTLFSNTLMNLSLPKAVTEMPRQGVLEHSVKGSGTIAPREEAELTGSAGQRVQQILVKEGEHVKKGQTLVVFDQRESKRQLLDEQAKLKRLQLSMDKTKEEFIMAQREEDEAAIAAAKLNVDLQLLDAEIQQRKIEELQDKLEQQRGLVAPFDGVVTQVVEESAVGTPGQPLVKLLNAAAGFKLETTVPEAISGLLKPGDKVTVTAELEGNTRRPLQAEVAGIEAATGEKAPGESAQRRLVIAVQGDELRGGERAGYSIQKQSGKSALLIPNGAVKEDATGAYVFKVRENKGALGNIWIASKSYIVKGDSNDKETVVERGLSADERIITDSSEPLQDSNRIRLN